MLKRTTAILFLTFASLIMLAFAVVPHHHHQEFICFNSTHGEHHFPAERHSPGDNPIQTGHHCVKNLFQTQVSRVQSLQHTCGEHCHHFIFVSFLVPDLSVFSSPKANGHVLPNTPYRERLHPSVYTSGFSGRAPPYFIG